MKPSNLETFLSQKGQEYAPFSPQRAIRIFKCFAQDFLKDFKPRVLHLVGTNGKGSTGRYITLGLKDFKVLHFTSPHLFCVNERFYRGGTVVSLEELEALHKELVQKDYMLECSYFEYLTFLALGLAKEMDYLVLEAGLGGEFDSTNVLKKKISVFTQIGLDHQEILGESLEQIARTKLNAMGQIAFLGIQKYPEVLDFAEQIAQEKQASLKILPQEPKEDYLCENLALANAVLDFLGVQDKPCKQDLDLPGRMQKYAYNVTLDVGHNVDGAKAILKLFTEGRVNLIYNAYQEKNVFRILEILKPILKEVLIIEVKNPRIIPQKELKRILWDLDIPFREFAHEIKASESYLVFGSFSVVQEFLIQMEQSCEK